MILTHVRCDDEMMNIEREGWQKGSDGNKESSLLSGIVNTNTKQTQKNKNKNKNTNTHTQKRLYSNSDSPVLGVWLCVIFLFRTFLSFGFSVFYKCFSVISNLSSLLFMRNSNNLRNLQYVFLDGDNENIVPIILDRL